MGFPLVRCQKALLATGNSDPEAAMEWLFAHMEDPGTALFSFPKFHGSDNLTVDIDDPIVIPQSTSGGGSGGPEPSAEQVGMLAEMGFSRAQARKALRETVRGHFSPTPGQITAH